MVYSVPVQLTGIMRLWVGRICEEGMHELHQEVDQVSLNQFWPQYVVKSMIHGPKYCI